MIEQLARGMNIYYRGYVIHEDIRHIHYTIYGMRPSRREVACAGGSQEAMRWIDEHIAATGAENVRLGHARFPTGRLPVVSPS